MLLKVNLFYLNVRYLKGCLGLKVSNHRYKRMQDRLNYFRSAEISKNIPICRTREKFFHVKSDLSKYYFCKIFWLFDLVLVFDSKTRTRTNFFVWWFDYLFDAVLFISDLCSFDEIYGDVMTIDFSFFFFFSLLAQKQPKTRPQSLHHPKQPTQHPPIHPPRTNL